MLKVITFGGSLLLAMAIGFGIGAGQETVRSIVPVVVAVLGFIVSLFV